MQTGWAHAGTPDSIVWFACIHRAGFTQPMIGCLRQAVCFIDLLLIEI